MPSQVIFLFDLDQCLPLACSLPSDELERQMSTLKHVCLKILCSASSLDGAEKGATDLAHFGFRFYSSTEYFLVPQDVDAAIFHELREDNFSLFESKLSDHFEKLWQESKTNSFDPKALLQHVECGTHKPHAQTLRKALEEIAVLYNWDRPMLHSPVKREGPRNPDENVVYIFTKLPNSVHELNQFLGSKSSQTRIQHNQIYDEVFNQSSNANSQVKNIINVFKGDANVHVTVIDTSTLYYNTDVVYDKRVKHAFQKCLKQFRGSVIPMEAFQPDVMKRPPEFPPTYTCNVSTLLSTYVLEEHEKRQKSGSHRPGVLKVEVNQSTTVSLNFELLGECKSSESIPQKAQASVRGLIPEIAFPVEQQFVTHLSVWPSRDQPSWSELFDRMRRHRLKLLIGFGDDKLGVISPNHDESGILGLLNRDDSSFYLLTCGLKTFSTSADVELPQNLQFLLEKEFSAQDLKQFEESEPEKGSVIPFQADCFDSWKVPESKPFSNIILDIQQKEDRKGPSAAMKRELQRAYLPARVSFLMDKRCGKLQAGNDLGEAFSRHRSEESVVSHISSKSNANDGTKKTLSRGAELMRLGSKNAELRRHSSEEAGNALNVKGHGIVNKDDSDFLAEKDVFKTQFEKELATKSTSSNDDDDKAIVSKLMGLQWNLLHQVGGSNAAIAALAEVTVSALLNHLQVIGKPKNSLEEMAEENFLVDPAIVGKRKTSKVQGGRVRDHKIQVLYRIEIHWLLASQAKQTELEQQILLHLRQISIWDSPEQMVAFLQDVVTPSYHIRQPELLYLIYEELNLPPPSCVRELFSPSQKSDCSSVQPSSANSESVRSNTSNAFDATCSRAANASQSVGMSKLRRMTSFDSNKLLQINVGIVDKKGGKPKPTANANILTAKRKTGRTPMKKAARRNLTFDGGNNDMIRRSPRKRLVSKSDNVSPKNSGCAKSNVKNGGGNKTPRKNVKTPVKVHKTPNKNDKTPRKGNKTPKKHEEKSSPKLFDKTPKKIGQTPRKEDATPRKRDFVTPCKMTPGKGHRILAPETPNLKEGGAGGRRKSDGKLLITESPDIDLIKQTKTTPRRMAASVALHKKTSFYSGNVSRNLIKAEEILDASRIQSSFMGKNTESQAIVGPLAKRLSDSEDVSMNASCFLFPHLVNKRKSTDHEDAEVTFRISDIVSPKKIIKLGDQDDSGKSDISENQNEDQPFSPELSGEADLFADEEDEEIQTKYEVSPDLRRPLRRLFADEDTEESSLLVTKNPKLKVKENKNVKTDPNAQTSRGDKTPIKGSGDAPLHKTPVKFIALSSSKSAPIDKTPVKSNTHQLTTPVKTPAQKRGDQNYGDGENTPVKSLMSRATRSGNQTPLKTLSLVNAAAPNRVQTAPKSPTSVKRRSQSVSTAENIEAIPTPAEESFATKSVTISIKKDVSQMSKFESKPTNKALVTPKKASEGKGIKPSTDATSTPTTITTPCPSDRPSRRKSVSIRYGIDDVPLTDAVWSPASKLARSPWRSDTPSKSGGMTPTASSRTCTPKIYRLLSPSAPNTDLNTPDKLAGGIKLKQRKTLKVSLFATDTETDTIDKVSLKSRKRCNKLEDIKDTEDDDPCQTEDVRASNSQQILPKRSTRSSDSGQLHLPKRGFSSMDSLPTRSSGRLAHHETFTSADRSKSKSKVSSFDVTENEGFELDSPTGLQTQNMTTIPLKLKLKSSDCDLNDSLGHQIKELCSKNRADNVSNTFVTPSLLKRKNGGSPKSRTPKRLRSGSKKSSPDSKRSRLNIEFTSNPPVITDTFNCTENRRKRKLTDSRTTKEFEEEDFSVRSPPPSGANDNSVTPLQSPGKFWSVMGIQESPRGEIKMKLNRKKKPEHTPQSLLVNRISRRMTSDVGISLDDLRKLMMAKSPSPKKMKHFSTNVEKENNSNSVTTEPEASTSADVSIVEPELDATATCETPRVLLRKLDPNRDALLPSSVDRKMKFSPLTSRGLITLTTSPIVDKKERGESSSLRSKHRKVNKRLYTDEDDNESY